MLVDVSDNFIVRNLWEKKMSQHEYFPSYQSKVTLTLS